MVIPDNEELILCLDPTKMLTRYYTTCLDHPSTSALVEIPDADTTGSGGTIDVTRRPRDLANNLRNFTILKVTILFTGFFRSQGDVKIELLHREQVGGVKYDKLVLLGTDL